MKKRSFIVSVLGALVLGLSLSSCSPESNKVYKSQDYAYKYEYAKDCFARGKYSRAIPLLQELVTIEKGTDNGEECLYMLAMAEHNMGDWQTASDYFKKYFQSYPKGQYAEAAEYYVGESLYRSTPEPRLDQSQTLLAIQAFQEYLDLYPQARYKSQAQDRLLKLQDKLVTKEYDAAKLYFDLGTYFGNCTNGGNNYQACIVTAQNAINDYPYSDRREDFAILVMKAKYELARMSVESKQYDRYQDAEDECYGFLNQYPDSKERVNAEKYIKSCQDYLSKHTPTNELVK